MQRRCGRVQDQMTSVAAAGHADAEKRAPQRSKSKAAAKRRTGSRAGKGPANDHKHLRETFGRRKSLASAPLPLVSPVCN